MTRNANLEVQLIEDLALFVRDPYRYALYAFPWGEKGGPLEHDLGPRDWQAQELSAITLHLENPATQFDPYMLAVASGHGVGKSAFMGMLVSWALDTCPDTRIVITANTDGQLKTKTNPEIIKWCRMAISGYWKEYETRSIQMKGRGASWRADFIPWSKHNTEAFAGLHNMRKRILILMDEGSAIDDKIYEVVEGALTDEHTEIIWIVFGNPTRNIGRFRECFRKYSKYWRHRHIDSRTVKGTNLKLFKRWEEQYGEDSDFFKVRVKGEFPSASARQLYPTDLIEKSQKIALNRDQFSFAPVIIGVDPSWTGDDEFVISLRQGLHFRILATYPKNINDMEMGGHIARFEKDQDADAVFIDGGYGTGIYSYGITLGRTNWHLVWFGGKSSRIDCVNKRDEMHMEALDWLKAGGAIPGDDTDLYEELIAQETMPTLDGKYKMIPKEDMKEVIGRSPNRLDSLVLTFAFPVKKRVRNDDLPGLYGLMKDRTRDYDPLASIDS